MLLNRFYKRLIRHPKSAIYSLLFYPFKVKRKKVVFSNFNGKGYGDNPKYIAEEMIRRNSDYEMVWLVNQYHNDIPQSIKQVCLASWHCAYELSTAQIIIINTKDVKPFFKKKNQYLIQTWHSTYGPKYVEKDAMDILPSKYIKDSIENSQETDLFLSPCKLQTEEFRHAFWCECEVMPSGIPRNDIYFQENSSLIESTKKKIGVPEDAKILIYAPTFRDNKYTDVYNSLDFEVIKNTLESKYGGKWYVWIRLHPGIAYNVDLKYDFSESMINVSKYDDIQELLLASNILITDYSSIMFDFALMKKPVFLFVPDVHDTMIRGLRPMFNDFPFPHCEAFEDLVSSLKEYSEEEYQRVLDTFMQVFQSYDDGKASSRVVDRINELMNLSN